VCCLLPSFSLFTALVDTFVNIVPIILSSMALLTEKKTLFQNLYSSLAITLRRYYGT
jgi:hypothetical protein